MIQSIVLGAAAGGGFPQWNCGCPACCRVRTGDGSARRCTQASLAVRAASGSWILLNASPDLRQQIEATPALQAQAGSRNSPIAGVVLTGGEVDTVAGLLTLRERQPLRLAATALVHALLDANPIFEALARDVVPRQVVAPGEPLALADAAGRPVGLRVTLFRVPGKVPLFLEPAPSQPAVELGDDAATTGALIEDDAGHRLFFVPGCAAMTPALLQRLQGAELVFFDGTLWRDDEMIRAGLGTKTGRRMGHMSVSGEDGAIAAFAGSDIKRKIFIHMNNTNPLLLPDSPERREAEAAGWQVAEDGMEVSLP